MRGLFLCAIVLTSSLGCVSHSFSGRRTGAAVGASVETLAFRNADDQLLPLNEPGKLYLLDFMAVGCKPCMEELPDLARLDREFGSSDRFQLVTVVHAWRGKELAKLGKQYDFGSLVLYADTEGFAQKLGVEAWPTKFLVRDGRVLLRRMGGGAGAYAEWRRIIEGQMK